MIGYDRDDTMTVDPAPASGDAPLPARIGGKYVPRRCLARGGMGTIYEVEHAHTGERWALKVLHGSARLDAQSLERFRREARVSTLVKSPHVVRVMDADVAADLDGAPFLVMELLEGDNLADATKREPQPPAVVLSWLRQVARALDKAHALGIVHRDLKPENLFLVRNAPSEDAIKVLDFGIAKVRESDESNKTASGAVVGTPLYMAPEQATGDSTKIGPATDVWALGLIAYRLLTGRDYWVGTNVAHVLAQIVYEPLELPSARGASLSKAFDRWFERSCDRDPEKRFTTVGEQIDALEEALASSDAPDTAIGSTATELEAVPSRRRRDPWLYMGIAGIATAAIAVMASFGDRTPAPPRTTPTVNAASNTGSNATPTPSTSPSTSAAAVPAAPLSVSVHPEERPPTSASAPTVANDRPSPASPVASAGRVVTTQPHPRDPAPARPKASVDPLADQH